ncbi:hypothetical protein J2777_003294 [Paraburkholderia graminis]|uniref:hypothetical protein n=1 Tax=Paraburkholderia graminis TaxID=60548 RepID=UPI002866BB1A|nr:hypothetical protein [Paraburkholderia graminis]MDR6469566.1 hypothetical protein [Paraburkholderia graminis]
MTDSVTLHYLNGATVICNACEKAIDWWEVTRKSIAENFMMNQAFAPIGARTVVFQLDIKKGQPSGYRLSEFGVPEGARVLYTNYSPEGTAAGALTPLEMHGNVATRVRPRDEVAFYPMPLGETPPDEAKVSVMVTWMPAAPGNAVWDGLVSAFEAYVDEKYRAAIVPANVAVEATLSAFMYDFLVHQGVGGKRADSFLSDAATYSHQLNVLLPLITGLTGLPKLSDSIRGRLNALRGLRNEVAHHGHTEKPLTKDTVAELLTAALFGLRYVQLLTVEWARLRQQAGDPAPASAGELAA